MIVRVSISMILSISQQILPQLFYMHHDVGLDPAGPTLRALYKDFPSTSDPMIRSTIISSIFNDKSHLRVLQPDLPKEWWGRMVKEQRKMAFYWINSELSDLKLTPLTKLDLIVVLDGKFTSTAGVGSNIGVNTRKRWICLRQTCSLR